MSVDVHSDTWRAVKAWAEGQHTSHLSSLKTPGTPENDTEGHRYALIVLEALLNLGKPSKMPPNDSSET